MLRKYLASVLTIIGLCTIFANPAMAFDIKSAIIEKLDCSSYTITVEGVADKGSSVEYQFTLTPQLPFTGSPTTVAGKIPVDGSFSGVLQSGSFTLASDGISSVTGTATLKNAAGGTVNTVAIVNNVALPIACPGPPKPRVEIEKFTNGHDGDNANGVPTPGQGNFTPGTNTVAEIPGGLTVTWTYRVKNTGSENLVKISVSDNRMGPITCPKDSLSPGEVMDCTLATGAEQLVTNPPRVIEGCGDGRPTYDNTGTVTAYGASSNTQVSDSDPSHYCNPKQAACNLQLDKSCTIVQPPTTDWASCKGKIQKFAMIWPGPDTISISGIANDAPGGVVNPGQKVTFTGPFSTNDLYLNILGPVNGQSTFHVSCSDADMDGRTSTNLSQPQVSGKAQDCGKFEGDGKAKSGTWINTWLLDGLVDAEGKVLTCSQAPPQPTSSCSFQQEEPPQCGTGGTYKPSTLTFQYTGGGCSTQSNSQAAGKTSCNGSINPALSVTVTANNGDGPFTVAPGGTFTINRNQAETIFTLKNAGGTETDKIHTSCSQPLIVGDVYFSLTLVAEDGIGVGKNIQYSYNVRNVGSGSVNNIQVTDDKLGAIGTIPSLGAGQSQTLTKSGLISGTTTNVATATGDSCPAPGVQATATVTVLPPLPCTVTEVLYDLTDDKIVYKLTNTGNKVVTLDTLTLNFPSGRAEIKEVKREGDTIYKSDQSNLVVTPGVTIGPNDWTNTDVNKRKIKPGETKKLEIRFTQKTKATESEFSGTVTFAEGCEVDLAP